MTKEHSHGSVGNYILVALILGVITYFEFAIVEYPQAWLGSTWTLVLLGVLSVVKFVMVVMFFMHLKGDDRLYSGFFSSGMLIAVLSFLAMVAMFILPRAMGYAEAEMVKAKAAGEIHAAAEHGESAGHGEAALDAEVLDLITTDGRSRSAADNADSPRPADRSLSVDPPTAANDASSYQVEAAVPPQEDGAALDAQAAAEDAAEAAAAAEEAEAAADLADDEVAADAADEAAGAAVADDEVDADAGAADDAVDASTEDGEADDGEVADAEVADGPSADAGAPVAWDEAQGQQVFTSFCSACHQMTGLGIPGAFPPLANHLGEIHEAGGREQLVRTVLFGLQGQIQVNGMTYNGFMPGWVQLDDASIANALNHVIVTLGDGAPAGFTPYTPGDVAAHRGDGLTPAGVHELRGELALD